MSFIPAAELKKEFDVFGHFYSLKTPTETYLCRSSLEIIKKGISLDSPTTAKADAIFVMMNPGSSRPLNNPDELVVMESNISKLKIELVPTKPDTTQYQLMRVMLIKNWNHVRVINLSDLRDPKSGSFIKLSSQYAQINQSDSHSIFSNFRSNELIRKLDKKDTAPTVLAWGVSDDLDPLIEKAVAKLKNHQHISGLKKDETDNKYYHPLPTLQKDKVAWVKNISSVL
jgi:hypothetical protein